MRVETEFSQNSEEKTTETSSVIQKSEWAHSLGEVVCCSAQQEGRTVLVELNTVLCDEQEVLWYEYSAYSVYL